MKLTTKQAEKLEEQLMYEKIIGPDPIIPEKLKEYYNKMNMDEWYKKI